MLWVVLAVIGACTNAAYYIANKKFLETIDPHILAAAGFLCTSFFLLSLSFFQGIPPLGSLFVFAVAATSLLNIVATTLTFRALMSTDISLAIPMISFTPLFLMGTAALILHEFPSTVGIAGIIIIVAGSYILNTTEGHTRITDPFRNMISHPGVMSMLFVAFLYAVAINFDKMVVQNSDAAFGSGIVFFVLGSAFLLIGILTRYPKASSPLQPLQEGMGGRDNPPMGWRWPDIAGAGLFIGIVITIEAVVINTAYMMQIVPYVIAIKRMSILLIVLYGALVFREKEILRRLSGTALMVLGAVMILLFP